MKGCYPNKVLKQSKEPSHISKKSKCIPKPTGNCGGNQRRNLTFLKARNIVKTRMKENTYANMTQRLSLIGSKMDEGRTSTMNQRTRKFMTMHKAFHPRDIERRYVSRK